MKKNPHPRRFLLLILAAFLSVVGAVLTPLGVIYYANSNADLIGGTMLVGGLSIFIADSFRRFRLGKRVGHAYQAEDPVGIG